MTPTTMAARRPASDAVPIAQRLGLIASGLLLASYPLTRPWADQETAGAVEAFASGWWVLSHTMAVLGFLALALALRGWPGQPWRRLGDSRRAEVRAWVAVAFLGPYYGAEAYGLHVIGQRALQDGDADLAQLADQFRYAAVPVTMFALGLLALALVGPRLISLTSTSSASARLGGLLAGVGLLSYLPQYFLPPAGRILHGVLLGVGLLLVGLSGVTVHGAERRRAPGSGLD